MLVSVGVLLTEAPMSGERTRFYRTCEKIRSSPHIEKILRAVRIMVRKYENGMVVFQTRICCTGALRLITRVFQWRWTNVSWGIFFTKILVVNERLADVAIFIPITVFLRTRPLPEWVRIRLPSQLRSPNGSSQLTVQTKVEFQRGLQWMDIVLHDYESYSRDNREYPTSSQSQRYTQKPKQNAPGQLRPRSPDRTTTLLATYQPANTPGSPESLRFLLRE